MLIFWQQCFCAYLFLELFSSPSTLIVCRSWKLNDLFDSAIEVAAESADWLVFVNVNDGLAGGGFAGHPLMNVHDQYLCYDDCSSCLALPVIVRWCIEY